jgi:hypothetical protein
MSYDSDSRSMAETLAQMTRQALNKCSGNQIEADEQVQRWIANDRRFDQYDAGRLASRVSECWSNGATLNLEDDPHLLRERPANRYGSGRSAR